MPEEDKARMLEMHEKIVRLEEECRTLKEQLVKARAVSILCSLSFHFRTLTAVFSSSKTKTSSSVKGKKLTEAYFR